MTRSDKISYPNPHLAQQARTGDGTIKTLVIYALIQLVFASAIIRKPAAAIAAVLCMYGLEQWAQGTSSLFVTHYKLINLVTGATVVAALMIKLFQGRLNLGAYPLVGWVVLALYTYAAMTFVWSTYPAGLVERMKLQFPYIITVVVLMPLLVYELKDLRTGMYYMLAVGSVLVVLLALTVEWTYRGIELQGIGDNKGNPLTVASMGGYVCIIAALMNFRGVARVWQILRWPIMAFGLYLPFVSGSRGQLIAAVVVIVAMLPISRRITNWKGFAGTVVAIGLFGIVAAVGYMMFATDARWDPQEMIANYGETRLAFSVTMFKTWIQAGPIYWVLGLGNSAAFAPWLIGIYPHFMTLEILTEEGLIGFSLLVAMLWLTVRSVRRIYPYVMDNPDLRGVLAAAAGIFLYDMILSCKQGSLLFNTYIFAFAIILGRVELSIKQFAAAGQWRRTV